MLLFSSFLNIGLINESGGNESNFLKNRNKILTSLSQKFHHKPYTPSSSSSMTSSKIFYLPTKYLSNAKPIFIKTLKPMMMNNGDGQKNTYYNYLF